MQELTEKYEDNLALLKRRLAPEESFDVICREILIGKDRAAFFYIDAAFSVGIYRGGTLDKKDLGKIS